MKSPNRDARRAGLRDDLARARQLTANADAIARRIPTMERELKEAKAQLAGLREEARQCLARHGRENVGTVAWDVDISREDVGE